MNNRAVLSLALCALTLSLHANAEQMEFTYEFTGTPVQQPWTDGATITVSFDGTVDSDHDSVTINSIDSIVLDRPGLPTFVYASVEAGEIETVPPGGTPSVSFSGTTLNFTICPSGFSVDTDGDGILDNCSYFVEGGFGMIYGLSSLAGDLALAADDTGTANCSEPGCPVADSPINLANWQLVGDADDDGFIDTADNCPDVENFFQIDFDGDGIGNACEIGEMQSFSDGARPLLSGSLDGSISNCVANGWLIFDCSAVVEGEDGPGDNAVLFDTGGGNFNFLTWEKFPYADTRFMGDLVTAEVVSIRFRARHAGGADPLVLRAMVANFANADGTDFAISDESATIDVGSGWATYEISLAEADLQAGTKLYDENGLTTPRRTVTEILTVAAQVSLRHDPAFTGPGTPAPTDSTMEIDDIELVGGGSTGLAFLLALSIAVYRRSRSRHVADGSISMIKASAAT